MTDSLKRAVAEALKALPPQKAERILAKAATKIGNWTPDDILQARLHREARTTVEARVKAMSPGQRRIAAAFLAEELAAERRSEMHLVDPV